MSYRVNTFLEGLQVFVSLVFLFYASWSDLKTREVSNVVWMLFAPIGLALTLTQMFLFEAGSGGQLYWFGISVGVTSVLALALFYAGAYGGADAKALICLSVTLPFYPSNFINWASDSPIFPLSVFSNAVIIAAFSVVYVLLRNVVWRQRTGKPFFEGFNEESRGRKFLTLLSGYKIKLDRLEKDEFLYPLEDVQASETGETKRTLVVFPKDEEREDIVQRIVATANRERNIDWVWATPGLPMLVFITVGLIVALVFGDFVWIALAHLLA
jgi:preflagellin peptidase FlaK